MMNGGIVALLLAAPLAYAYEAPAYEVVTQYPAFELRRYPPYWVAKFNAATTFDDVGDAAFMPLAEYIGGANDKQRQIDMTVPVEQQPMDAAAQGYHFRFFIPLADGETAPPQPTNPQIKLRQLPGGMVAALRYSGGWSEQRYLEHEARLLKAARHQSLTPIAPPIFARYNPPFWPLWFLRRNEVLLPVKKIQSDSTPATETPEPVGS